MRNLTCLLVSSVLLVSGAAASAAEVCVSCTGPAATYACSVKNGDAIEGVAGDKALRKICTKVLKLTERHTSCQALDVPAGKCAGTARTVSWSDVKKAVAAREAEPPATEPKGQPAAKATKPPAREAVSAEKAPTQAAPVKSAQPAGDPAQRPGDPAQPEPTAPEGLGDKIKNAAQSTWSCMASLFGNC